MSATQLSSELVVDMVGDVVVLTIDRPSRRNAIGENLVDRLAQELELADRDQNTRAIVPTGAAPGFCAGSDLKELAGMDLAGMRMHEARTAALARTIALLDTPVVAGVDGFALGGGFLLALSCDVVVTSPSTRWHLPEVSIGWIPPWGLQALVARVGPVVARRMVWGADALDGQESYRCGIADYLTAPGESVKEAALHRAQQIAALPGAAVASTKQFFAPLVAGAGESFDASASRLFVTDCAHPAARTTLTRFGVKQ